MNDLRALAAAPMSVAWPDDARRALCWAADLVDAAQAIRNENDAIVDLMRGAFAQLKDARSDNDWLTVGNVECAIGSWLTTNAPNLSCGIRNQLGALIMSETAKCELCGAEFWPKRKD